MNPKQQYLLVINIIDLIRDHGHNADLLEYIDSICYSIGLILGDKSVVDWFELSSMCDQVWYGMSQGEAVKVNPEDLDSLYRKYGEMAGDVK